MRETDPRGNNTTYTVDEITSQNTKVTDRCNVDTNYEYDSLGRTTKVSQGDAFVQYSYNGMDALTEIARGDNQKYTLAYTTYGDIESIGIYGKPGNLAQYTYNNGSGNLKTITYANGHTMKASYNSQGQMISEKWYAESDCINLVAEYKYVYDSKGNVARAIDLLNQKEYTYVYVDDKLTRMSEYNCLVDSTGIATRRNLVNTVLYEYAKDGNLKLKKTVPASGVQTIVEYNEKETVVTVGDIKYNIKSETDGLGRKEYDHIGLYDNVLSREFSYHQGKVTQEHKDNNKVLDAATTNLVKAITYSDGRVIEYEYDNEERITKVIDTKPDNLQTVTEYTYDNAGQLLSEKVNGNVINTMVYDLYGNIQSKNGKIYEYDSVWKDLLISYDGQDIIYDNQGNPTTYLGNALTFEKGRQLKTFGNVSFKYNANGIRTEKTVGDVLHTYTVDGSKILKESWSGRTIIPMYNEEEVIGIRYNGLAYYFIKNLQGDVISITDADGNVVAEYSYDAWGVPTVISDISGKSIAHYNPYRYRSYYYDKDTGLYYLQSRYYDPMTGRFVNSDDPEMASLSDSILQSNLFAYCENDAVNCVDEYGKRKKYKVSSNYEPQATILTIPQFDIESAFLASSLDYIGTSVVTMKKNNVSSFKNKWKALGEKEVVIINCHGSPKRINGAKLNEISTFKKLNVKLLIILACNAGHYNYKWSNVGYEFSKKVTGKVVCSDGTVYTRNPFTGKFESVNDESFRKIFEGRQINKGWCVYGKDGLKFPFKKVIHLKTVISELC